MTNSAKKRMGFYVDFGSCTGCKACQLACKNKNNLDVGVLWRRVVQVESGDWQKQGDVWANNVSIYYLSLSCMHCEKPICVEVCPTRAASKRDDGVVSIDQELCIGCSYCEMACPYGSPRLNPVQKTMTKCDLCKDNLDKGAPPECVSACQMRILEVGDIDELKAKHRAEAIIFPLPDKKLTEPSILLGASKKERAVSDGAKISNKEEL